MDSEVSLIVPDSAYAYVQHAMLNMSTEVQLAVIRMVSKSEHPVDIHICMLSKAVLPASARLTPLLCMQLLLPPS